MTPLDAASLVLVVGPLIGLGAAAVYALARRGRTTGLAGGTVLARSASYAVLAAVLLVAARTGVAGMAVFLGLVGAAALIEWGRLFDLPLHHRVALVIAHAIAIAAVAVAGTTAVPALVGGIVLWGAAWPVIRADTGRAIRDLGYAAVGAVLVTVMLVHGVALVHEFGANGSAAILALAVGCAGSDIGAFLVGKRFGRHPLAPRLSPSKTREGLIGNVLGAAVGLAPFLPAFVPGGVPILGWAMTIAFVPLVAAGAVWGDLLESAAKREAGVKDAGHWLPGFGGILDRVDSLLVTIALAYWLVQLGTPRG
jgi:phosphatidate cytidylyltransferase